MSFLDGLVTLIDTLSPTRRMERLLSLSDRELARRGLNRETLARSYLAGLGAR